LINSSFGVNGFANPVLNNDGLSPDDMALQTDGKIVVAGTSRQFLEGNMTIARYQGSIATTEAPAKLASNPVELYPNPSAGLAQLRLTLLADAQVDARLTDLLGRTVLEPVQAQDLPAGVHAWILDAQTMPAGTYIAKVLADGQLQTHRMVIAH
jgi:hypothetical protein